MLAGAGDQDAAGSEGRRARWPLAPLGVGDGPAAQSAHPDRKEEDQQRAQQSGCEGDIRNAERPQRQQCAEHDRARHGERGRFREAGVAPDRAVATPQGFGGDEEERTAEPGFEIERDALLVSVEGHEPGAFAVHEGAGGATEVPAARILDLDDLSTQVGQQHTAVWAGDVVRQLQHADPLEWGRGASGIAAGLPIHLSARSNAAGASRETRPPPL